MSIDKTDGEEITKWLEELVHEAALNNPVSDRERLLKQMITSAWQKLFQTKLSLIIKGRRQPLDCIKVPAYKWFHIKKLNELYGDEFNVASSVPIEKALSKRHLSIMAPSLKFYQMMHKLLTLKYLTDVFM